MFDIGWTELLVIATVAILVVGPKDLPRMLRSFGRTMGQVRRMSNDFKRQFDDALREAERESGLDETRKDLQAMSRANPLKDAQRDLDKSLKSAKPKPAVADTPAKVDARPHEAEPLKTGATTAQGTGPAAGQSEQAGKVEPVAQAGTVEPAAQAGQGSDSA